jgi:hypothetical protein
MKISRRTLIGATIGAAAAAGVGVVTFARSGDTAAAAPSGGKYQPGPGGKRGPGDMIMQLPNARWSSHLLPFTAPFKDLPSLQAELRRARAQKLIG